MSELKEAMHQWFNISPDEDYQSFDSYFEMAVRKKDVKQFSIKFFRYLAQHADEQDMLAIDCPAYSKQLLIEQLEINSKLTERLTKMTDSAINRPVVLKTLEDADVVEQRKQFNKAIELLEACSDDLMFSGNNTGLERQVDEFLKEVTP